MAIIPQKTLFRWTDVEALDDLHRLRLVLESVPDEALMRTLERRRGKGRDDYPIRAVFNSLLAGVVFGHASIASLSRELQRNAPLRAACGFDVVKGAAAVPPAWAYSRFLDALGEHGEALGRVFEALVAEVARRLPDFGRHLAIDGKAIRSHARPRPRGAPRPPRDGRRDIDADFGAKRGGFWYGTKLHLLADTTYDLPVARELTPASHAESPAAHRMLDELEGSRPEVLDRAETCAGDKGYDDTKLHTRLWDAYEIGAVIPIRDDWPESEPTRVLAGHTHITYTQQGRVCCWPKRGAPRPMAFGGFERDRDTLKYRCPARAYGLTCDRLGRCPKQVRIALGEDRRVFGPVARSSTKWHRLYNGRSAVERVNGRLDVSFGFERHFVRGLDRMRLKVDLALIVMLAMAVGRIDENQAEALRSLVAAA